jgi:hypothetical protein
MLCCLALVVRYPIPQDQPFVLVLACRGAHLEQYPVFAHKVGPYYGVFFMRIIRELLVYSYFSALLPVDLAYVSLQAKVCNERSVGSLVSW